MNTPANKYPFEFHFLEGEEKNPEVAKKMVFVGPKRYCFKKKFQTIANYFYNMNTRPSDVWLYGFPRSGTTMLQEITWLIGSNLDYEQASQIILDVRYPFLEKEMTMNVDIYENIINNPDKYTKNAINIAKVLKEPNWIRLEQQKDRRFIKTHIPLSLGPQDLLKSGCKIFYLARNPKDLLISNYELFVKTFQEVEVGLETNEKEFVKFWENFKNGFELFTPYFENLKEGWELSKTNPNILFIFYEDFHKNMRQTLIKIASHLNEILTEDELKKLEEHMRIENFRKNKMVNNDYLREIGRMRDEPDRFIRKGKVGGWKEEDAMKSINKEVDDWIQENLKTMGLEDLIFTEI